MVSKTSIVSPLSIQKLPLFCFEFVSVSNTSTLQACASSHTWPRPSCFEEVVAARHAPVAHVHETADYPAPSGLHGPLLQLLGAAAASHEQGNPGGGVGPSTKKRRLSAGGAGTKDIIHTGTLQEEEEISACSQQPKATKFWQTAWHALCFYLALDSSCATSSSSMHPAPDASMQTSCCGNNPPPPIDTLSAEEQWSLRQISQRVLEAEVTRAQRQLAHLNALALAPLAAPPAGAPTAASGASGATMVNYPEAPAHLSTGGGMGGPKQLLQQSGMAAAAGAAGLPHAVAAGMPSGGSGGGIAPMHTASQNRAAHAASPGGSLLRRGNSSVGRPVGAGNRAHMRLFTPQVPLEIGGGLVQQHTAASAAAQQPLLLFGAPQAAAGSTAFALRSPNYTGVYRSRRAGQGWRAQFAFANKVG